MARLLPAALALALLAGCSGGGGGGEEEAPPDLALTVSEPANLSVVRSASVTVRGAATGPAAVTRLAYTLNGGAEQDETDALDAGGAFAFGLTLLQGVNALTLTARDADGRTATTVLSVTYAPRPSADVTPPVITLTAPAPSAVLTGPLVTVRGTATDDVGVASLTWSLDSGGAVDATAALDGDAFAFDVTLAPGPHTIVVYAYDAAGNRDTALLSVTFQPEDAAPPVVVLTAPADGAAVEGEAVAVTGFATDDVGVTALAFRVDDGPEQDVTAALTGTAFAFDAPVPEGVHTLTVLARDAAGGEGSAAVSVERAPSGPGVAVTVDLADERQVLRGWGATADAGQVGCAAFDSWADEALDLAVDGLGVDRLRLALYPGMEGPTDAWAALQAGEITVEAWRAARWDGANDDGDPATAAAGGFHFGALDDALARVAGPLRERLEARGEALGLTLAFEPGPPGDGGDDAFAHLDAPAEYAELVAAAFAHLEATWGAVPDALEVAAAPEAGGLSAEALAAALVAVRDRLAADGWTPALLAPAAATPEAAVGLAVGLGEAPGALDAWTTLAWGRAAEGAPAAVAQLGALADGWGLEAAVTAAPGAGVDALLEDLTLGGAGAWLRGPLAGCGEAAALGWIAVDEAAPEGPAVAAAPGTRLLAPVLAAARAGTRRVAATSASGEVVPLALVAPDGAPRLVLRAASATLASVGGLPPGTWEAAWTGAAEGEEALTEVTFPAEGKGQLALPGDGVMVLRPKPAAP